MIMKCSNIKVINSTNFDRVGFAQSVACPPLAR